MLIVKIVVCLWWLILVFGILGVVLVVGGCV